MIRQRPITREPDCPLCGDGTNPDAICPSCQEDLAWELWGPSEDDPRFWEDAGFSLLEVEDHT